MLKKTLAILATAAILAGLGGQRAVAQEAPYKFDIGGLVGVSGYLGDVNESNFLRRPGLSAAARFGYIHNVRWGFRGQLGVMTLSGNSADFGYVYPDGMSYSFNSTVVDLGGRFEFNFLPYGIGETYKRLRRWSPYLAAGVGASLAMAKNDGTFVAFNIPLAVGVKYKLRERLNLAVEFSITKVFGDRVDGNLDDLYTIKSSFLKNTDWYTSIGVALTYEFGKRCETCNRID